MRTIIIQPNNKLKTGWLVSLLVVGCFLLALAWSSSVQAGTTALSLSTWFVEMDRYEASAHGSLECEECHGPMVGKAEGKSNRHPDSKAMGLPGAQTKRHFDYQVCKNCHESEHELFLKGEHATAAIKENENGKPSEAGFTPTCGDCHSAHYP